MTHDMGEELTRWTIRLALAAYVAVLVLQIREKPGVDDYAASTANSGSLASARGGRLERGLWTVGCILLWAHVAVAFAVYHHWSHDDAYTRTARETAQAVGIDWGGGLYFNYLCLLLWTFDVIWWWARPTAYRGRSWIWQFFLQAYLAFMAINATVVFGHGVVRYLGIAATLTVVWLVWRRLRSLPLSGRGAGV